MVKWFGSRLSFKWTSVQFQLFLNDFFSLLGFDGVGKTLKTCKFLIVQCLWTFDLSELFYI